MNESNKPVQKPKIGPDYRYIPQVYSARVITGTLEPMINPADFGSDLLVHAYMDGFARICKDIVLW